MVQRYALFLIPPTISLIICRRKFGRFKLLPYLCSPDLINNSMLRLLLKLWADQQRRNFKWGKFLGGLYSQDSGSCQPGIRGENRPALLLIRLQGSGGNLERNENPAFSPSRKRFGKWRSLPGRLGRREPNSISAFPEQSRWRGCENSVVTAIIYGYICSL